MKAEQLENPTGFQLLLKKAAGTLGLRIFNTGISFVTTVVLARLIGASSYGAYAYAIAWLQVLTLVSTFGLERVIVRNLAVYRSQGDWSHFRGLWKWANKVNLLLSIAVAGMAVLYLFWVPGLNDMGQVVAMMLAGVPLLALSRVRQATLQGLNRVVHGQLADMALRPLVFLIGVALVAFFARDHLSGLSAAVLQFAAIFVAFVFGNFQLMRYFPAEARTAEPEYARDIWAQSAVPLLLITFMYLANNRIATILLGNLRGAQDVGLFSVAEKGSEIIGLFLFAFTASLAPVAAKLHAEGSTQELQKLVFQSSRVVIACSSLAAIFIVVFAREILGIFGPEFIEAERTLWILIAAQLVNTFFGPVNTLLVMSGHERDAARGILLGLALNIGLTSWLAPQYGAIGAAIAVAVSMVVWNAVASRYVYKRLGIRSTWLISQFGKLS